jgi:hypothetical protein
MASRTSTPDKTRVDGTTPDPEARTESAPTPDATKKNGVLSKVKGFWTGLALDAPTLITMAKYMTPN